MYSGQTRNSAKEDLGAAFSVLLAPGGFPNAKKWHKWESAGFPRPEGRCYQRGGGQVGAGHPPVLRAFPGLQQQEPRVALEAPSHVAVPAAERVRTCKVSRAGFPQFLPVIRNVVV